MVRNATHQLAAIVTVALLTGASRAAQAAGPLPGGGGPGLTFKEMSANIAVASSGFTNLISIICWVCSAGLGVVAIVKLKQHVDSGGQTPIKEGLIRLAAGGALLAFPFIEQAMQGSVSNAQLAKLNATALQMDSTVAFQ